MDRKKLLRLLPLGLRRVARIVALHGWGLFSYRSPFEGVYKSFADVGGTPPESDMTVAAMRGRGPDLDETSGLPILPASRIPLPMVVGMLARPGQLFRVLDFGGAAGVGPKRCGPVVCELIGRDRLLHPGHGPGKQTGHLGERTAHALGPNVIP